MQQLTVQALFDLDATIAADVFKGVEYPWEILPKLKEFIRQLGRTLDPEIYEEVRPEVWIARDAVIAPSASIAGPVIIDRGAEVRPCAFIRGSAVVGKKAVVGNSTELKNALLFDGVQVPHFNYVGDSVLGRGAHLGAGAVTSNVRSDKKNVVVHGETEIETGLRKLGAMVGDRVEVGCNSVLNPGSVLGRDCMVYPTSCVRGVVPEKHIWKGYGRIAERKEG